MHLEAVLLACDMPYKYQLEFALDRPPRPFGTPSPRLARTGDLATVSCEV